MDIIDELRAFVATAQSGSFTEAARQLGVSNRLTSKYVADLEARLGARLLQRTTRKVGLTPAGEDLLARAPALLDDLDGMLSDVSEGSRGLTGAIRISAPVTFGEMHLGGLLARFARQHPDLVIDLRLHDGFADLASEGIDVAFRIGRSDMLSLKTLKLGEVRSVIGASPDYLARHGAPRTPEDLAHHTCILDTNRRDPRRWSFEDAGQTKVIEVSVRFQVNSARAAVELAAGGLGICYGPGFALADAFATGRLVPLLGHVDCETAPISAVYLEGRTLPRKVRALIDFAARDIRSTGIL